ncbi:pre-RNA processing PIH1/Nop17-domain-containing protein [Mycena amicta]|nr:pre-RNA processing PIH1/Nop17-domain-containing protein [Mycena amicta]
MASTRVLLKPKAGHCLKTSTVTSAANIRKIFINLAFDDNVPAPPEGNTEAIRRAMRGEDASSDAWFVPVVVSEAREDTDKAGKSCLVFDCIFNSVVRSLSLRDPLFKTFIQELSLQRVEAQTSLVLSREIATPNIASKGKLLPRTAVIPSVLPPPNGLLIEEIKESSVAVSQTPKGILKSSPVQIAPAKLTWSWSIMPESGTIEISVSVPLLTRTLIPRTTIDIEARRIILSVPTTPPLNLDINLGVSDAEICATTPGARAALKLKRERALNVDVAQVEWRVADKILVLRC